MYLALLDQLTETFVRYRSTIVTHIVQKTFSSPVSESFVYAGNDTCNVLPDPEEWAANLSETPAAVDECSLVTTLSAAGWLPRNAITRSRSAGSEGLSMPRLGDPGVRVGEENTIKII